MTDVQWILLVLIVVKVGFGVVVFLDAEHCIPSESKDSPGAWGVVASLLSEVFVTVWYRRRLKYGRCYSSPYRDAVLIAWLVVCAGWIVLVSIAAARF